MLLRDGSEIFSNLNRAAELSCLEDSNSSNNSSNARDYLEALEG
jgi:hypothetical protein